MKHMPDIASKPFLFPPLPHPDMKSARSRNLQKLLPRLEFESSAGRLLGTDFQQRGLQAPTEIVFDFTARLASVRVPFTWLLV